MHSPDIEYGNFASRHKALFMKIWSQKSDLGYVASFSRNFCFELVVNHKSALKEGGKSALNQCGKWYRTSVAKITFAKKEVDLL